MSAYASDNPAALHPGKRPPLGSLALQLTGAAALVALADFLFYDRAVGLSLALFLLALAAASACLNRVRAGSIRRMGAFLLLGAGLLPILEDVGPLSILIALTATAVFARMLSEARALSWQEHLRAALGLPLSGPFNLLGDLVRARRASLRGRKGEGIIALALGWTIPLGLCGVFAALFVAANPLLERWLNRLDPLVMLEQLLSWRAMFWAAILCLIWPLVRMRSLRRKRRAAAGSGAPIRPQELLGDRTVRRSLILFNGLFAIQTAMDIAYLWGGVALPAGMSHAAYAHRGAYPLIVTALLAAAFVIMAVRPDGAAARDRLVRPLVLAWVGQNVMLVMSALLRLDLYVAAYSLTSLRLAAFVWMLVVAIGLVLILVQILTRRSVGWLVSANALALALTLYGYSFVDTAVVIANYNIRHSFQMRGVGQSLDAEYLFRLGPGVIPAIDRYAPRIAAAGHVSPHSSWASASTWATFRRERMAAKHHRIHADWRAWSVRGWRLSRYLANTAEAPFKAKPAAPADNS
nr:DUF4173 domain-containing protein [Methylobacterium sp. ZNC0032]